MLHYQVVLKDNEKRVKSTAILYHINRNVYITITYLN